MEETRYENDQGLWALHERVVAKNLAHQNRASLSPSPSIPRPSLNESSDDEMP